MVGPSEHPVHILVVDDDPRIRQMLTRYFGQEGYQVSVAADGAAMYAQLSARPVDLILLDVVMPGQDGLTIAREIRAKSDVGIIMLTGKDEVLDRVVGLEVGADDYIAKPFHLREVLARVKSVVRRRKPKPVPAVGSENSGEDIIRFEGWLLDIARRRLVSPNAQDIALTSGEFDLLAALAKNSGRVLSRETLMEHTRGRGLKAFDRTIDAQIARLRKKIERNPKSPSIVKSVRAVGYVFAAKVDR